MKSIQKASKILVVDAGGTIAQIRDKATGKLTYSINKDGEATIFLTKQQQRILRKISDFESVFYTNKDSTEFGTEDWANIAKIIYRNGTDYSSFIVTHGTATMCFTSSALSFMLWDLRKPVVFTGSQLPMCDSMTLGKTDAWNNLLNSFLVASSIGVNEISIVFGSKIFRGNRTTKVSMFDFDAYNSPNFPVLGRIGAGIEYTPYNFLEERFEPRKWYSNRFSINSNVGLLKLHPGLTERLLRQILETDIDALVIESYIPGLIPTKFEHVLRDCKKKVIAVCCQLGFGRDYSLLNLDHQRHDYFLPAYDMTAECAVSKLMWVLGQTKSMQEIRQLFCSNIAGEVTEP